MEAAEANGATATDAEAPIVVDTVVPDGAQGVTAFFLFSNVHRDRVKQNIQHSLPEGGKVTIGMVGKRIGQMWKSSSDEVKAAYAAAAKEVCQCS